MLDVDERSDEKSSAMATTLQDDTIQDDAELIHARLKDALKNIPDEGVQYSEEQLKEVKKKFKSSDRIKEELKEMNMKINSDFELMSDLFRKYDTIKGRHDLIELGTLFEDLKYLMHQIDNANDFLTAGGLDKVILPNLNNQSKVELRIHSVKLLGVVVQNNPKGQIAAFEKNVGSILLQLLAQSSSSSTNELSSLIFAFGGLLRKFPLAQEELLNNPGLNVLIDLLDKQVEYKIKMKCLLLIADLIRDYDELTDNGDLNKTTQYNAVDIKSRLFKTEYCTIMVELFSVHRHDYLENLYVAEDMLNVLLASIETCESKWIKSQIFRHTLLVIRGNYDQVKDQTSFDNLQLNEVVDKLEQLQTFFPDHTVANDEL